MKLDRKTIRRFGIRQNSIFLHHITGELTMHKKLFAAYVILLPFFAPISFAQSFEDGFKNGMSKQRVKEIVDGWNFDFLQEADNTITCYDNPNKGTYRLYQFLFWLYQFLFCKNELYYFRKNYKPLIKNFILIFDKLSSKYGNKIKAYSNIELTSSGETRSILLVWDMTLLRVKLHYWVFETNDSIYVEYEANNACDKR